MIPESFKQQAGKFIVAALSIMLTQRIKGIQKYGQALEDAPKLTTRELIRHAQEEAADLCVYLAAADERLERELAEARRAVYADILRIIEDTPGGQSDLLILGRIVTLAQQETLGMERGQSMTMYAQPSELQNFNKTGANLLTLARNNNFPFTLPMKVTVNG